MIFMYIVMGVVCRPLAGNLFHFWLTDCLCYVFRAFAKIASSSVFSR